MDLPKPNGKQVFDREVYRKEWARLGTDLFYERYQNRPGIYLSMLREATRSPLISRKCLWYDVLVESERDHAVATIAFVGGSVIEFELAKNFGREWIEQGQAAIDSLSVMVQKEITHQLDD
jgi:hypothetical protein